MLRRFDRLYDEVEKLMNATLVIGAVVAGVLVVNAVAKPTIAAALGWANVSDLHLGFAEKAVRARRSGTWSSRCRSAGTGP